MAQTKAQLIDGKGDAVINNKLLMGTSTANGTNQLQIEGSLGSNISLRRGEAPGNITSGEFIGGIEFQDNAEHIFGIIECRADANAGTNDYPGRLSFSTTADGASSPTERLRIANNGQLSAVVPGNSTLYPGFLARAWVNFNGTSTVSIRANGNVSSITDNGTGDYTVNFTTAMPDANYAITATGNNNITGGWGWIVSAPYNAAPTTSAVRVVTGTTVIADLAYVHVAIFC